MKRMNKHITTLTFAVGLLAVAWVAWGFVGTSHLALAMTLVIAGVYLLGNHELMRVRAASATLAQALRDMPQPLQDLEAWLAPIEPGLRHAVRQRIERDRAAWPGPALTPYLIGLLVMLGMLGTFLGMVVTFKGAVFALEGSADLAAIRAALAEPIKGLSLSFGTSVAGVATSAMLGLISAIGRRERLALIRELDTRMATTLRPYSLAQREDAAQQALQTQAQALPQVAEQLKALANGLERRTEQLHAQLLDQQQAFHHEATQAYTTLASSVGSALKDALRDGARLTGEAIQPVMVKTMGEIAQHTQRVHQGLVEASQGQLQALMDTSRGQLQGMVDTSQMQLQGLATQWADTARTVSSTWTSALAEQSTQSDKLLAGLDRTLDGFTQTFGQRAEGLVSGIEAGMARAQVAQQVADAERLQAMSQSTQALAQTLVTRWQEAGAQALAQQQAVCQALETAAGQITQQAGDHVGRTLVGITEVLNQSEALVRSRVASEAEWANAQGTRMAELTGIWRTELSALRQEEAQRAQSAMARLDALHGTVAQHLASLGASLEAPMTRLLQTASEVPQAAAQVIGQLRQEMTHLSERDNAALAERSAMTAQLGTLLSAIASSTVQQRGAVEGLVTSATQIMQAAGNRFADALGAQAGKVDEVASRVAASAVELASLGEAFQHGVALFSASNAQLGSSLQEMEAAIGQSMSRSDEQLAYYVAQARELIDLSISAQQGIVEDLRRLHSKSAALAAGVA
jgi:hypothetical protein